MTENTDKQSAGADRWTLIRDVAVLQFKLVVDGLRDFLLVPTSLVAGFISLINSRDGVPGPAFYRLLAIGKKSERWIDLFAAHSHSPDATKNEDAFGEMNIDQIVGRVEVFVVDEYKRGGITAQAKEKIDRALNAIQQRRRRRNQE